MRRAFLTLLLLFVAVPAWAQGVGFWSHPDCTTHTGAVAGRTVCWDETSYRWRVWDGTRFRDVSFQIASNGVYFDSVGAASAVNNAIILRSTRIDGSTSPIEVLRIDQNGDAYLKSTSITAAIVPLGDGNGGTFNTVSSSSSSGGGLSLRNIGSFSVGQGVSISMYGNTVAAPGISEQMQTVLNSTWTASALENRFLIGIRLSDATVTGTLATTSGSTAVVGTGTAFKSEFLSSVGEQMIVTFLPVAGACTGGTQTVTIVTTTDNTHLTTAENLTQTCTASTAVKTGGVQSRYTFGGQGTSGTATRQAGLLIGNLDGLVPAEPLHVIANTAATGIRLQRLSDTARAWSWRIQSTGAMSLTDVTAGADRVTIDTAGLTTIGTTAASGGFTAELAVGNTVANGIGVLDLTGSKTGANGAIGVVQFINAAIGVAEKRLGILEVDRVGADDTGDLILYLSAAGAIAEKFRVTSAGGLSVNGTAGQSVTTTVRASGGAADCTLIFTSGLKTGGTC